MPDFPNHPLADELAPGGAIGPALIALAGFLGASQREGYRRLYLTPTFDDYIEFRAEDLRHVEAGDEGQPLAAQLVWLRRDAEITRARVEQRKLQGDWLTGEIASSKRAIGQMRMYESPLEEFAGRVALRLSLAGTCYCPESGFRCEPTIVGNC